MCQKRDLDHCVVRDVALDSFVREIRENGVFATRKLVINGDVRRVASVSAVSTLCKAWQKSSEQAVVVE